MMNDNVKVMENGELRFKDLVFEKESFYSPDNGRADKNGEVTWWHAVTPEGHMVAEDYTKKGCIKAAREYVRNLKVNTEETVEAEDVQEAEMELEAVEAPETAELPEEETAAEVPAEESVEAEEAAELKENAGSETVEETVEENGEDMVDRWLLGYIPKKRHAAIVKLSKDENGYWCKIGNGFTVETGAGYEADTIHEAKWKEFLKAFRYVVKAA